MMQGSEQNDQMQLQFQALWNTLPSMTDEEAKDRFERGLQPVIRAEVAFQFPSSTSKSMCLALLCDSQRTQSMMAFGQGAQGFFGQSQPQQQQSQQPNQYHVPEYMRSSGVAPMDLDAICTRGLGSSWRSPSRGSNSDNWRRQSGSRDGDTRQCYSCTGFGHIARNCPSARGLNKGRQGGQGKGKARLD